MNLGLICVPEEGTSSFKSSSNSSSFGSLDSLIFCPQADQGHRKTSICYNGGSSARLIKSNRPRQQWTGEGETGGKADNFNLKEWEEGGEERCTMLRCAILARNPPNSTAGKDLRNGKVLTKQDIYRSLESLDSRLSDSQRFRQQPLSEPPNKRENMMKELKSVLKRKFFFRFREEVREKLVYGNGKEEEEGMSVETNPSNTDALCQRSEVSEPNSWRVTRLRSRPPSHDEGDPWRQEEDLTWTQDYGGHHHHGSDESQSVGNVSPKHLMTGNSHHPHG